MAEMSIEDMLNQCQEASQKMMDGSSEKWAPPAGTYTCVMKKPRMATYQRDGGTYGIVSLVHEIVDGPLAGKTFEFPFFGSNKVHCGLMKAAASAFSGGKSSLYSENARALMTSTEGRTAVVEYTIKPSDSGDGWPNIKYLTVS